MMPKISLTKAGKKLSFKKFAEIFSDHFKALHPSKRDEAIKESYTKLTGKKVGNVSSSGKKSEKV